MWFPKIIAFIMLYALAGNLVGVTWGWFKRDLWAGWMIAVIGGSGVSIVMIALIFVIWILMGTPTS